ncbi:hypothetical protein [Streptomyces adustus]|uniref:hypothetical protein n=1 Tax=Streptomyces adustus TaxID=1609272 RepID=UPI00372180EE
MTCPVPAAAHDRWARDSEGEWKQMPKAYVLTRYGDPRTGTVAEAAPEAAG